MNKRNLAAIWPMFVPKPKPEAELKREPQREEWNQEEMHFRNGRHEPVESPQEKVQRLAPSFGDLKRLVL